MCLMLFISMVFLLIGCSVFQDWDDLTFSHQSVLKILFKQNTPADMIKIQSITNGCESNSCLTLGMFMPVSEKIKLST